MRKLYRIFNRGSFSNGGRFYGTWWQQIPKEIRPQLLIDGEPTIEHDYPQLHPNMLYAQIGARLEGDAYAVDGWPSQRKGKPGFRSYLSKWRATTLTITSAADRAEPPRIEAVRRRRNREPRARCAAN
jgi:hypothetical protein